MDGAELRIRHERTSEGRSWIMFVARICELHEIDVRAAFAANRVLPSACLAILNTTVVLRQSVPLGTMTPVVFDAIVNAFNIEVRALELARSGAADRFAYIFRAPARR